MLKFKHRRIIVRECKRIQFLLKRDGWYNTKKFAKQGLKQYNNSLKSGYGKSYSEELRGSIVAYIMVLKRHGDINV